MRREYRVSGGVIAEKSGDAMEGLRVDLYDRDLRSRDMLGSAKTDSEGQFDFSFSRQDFDRTGTDREPELYLRVSTESGDELYRKRIREGRVEIRLPENTVEKTKGEKMSDRINLKGKVVKRKGEEPLEAMPLEVYAYEGDRLVGKTDVDESGNYDIEARRRRTGSQLELTVVPKLDDLFPTGEESRMLSYRKRIHPTALDREAMIEIPDYFDRLWHRVRRETYRIYGTVYAAEYDDYGALVNVDELPGVKLEFVEVGTGFEEMLPFLGYSSNVLGYTHADPDGDYEFTFDWTTSTPLLLYYLFTDNEPDIKIRIYQLHDGGETLVHERPTEWNLENEAERDIFVDREDLIETPDIGDRPEEGFQFRSLGLMPVDTTRIDAEGLGTTHPGDPVRFAKAPFGGLLRIFGLFAETPAIEEYRVQFSPATEIGGTLSPTGDWSDVTDPLNNRKWNATEKRWENVSLGPDPDTHRYRNIDTEPEWDWHEHGLKIMWNTTQEPDGAYALRIIGYDSSGTEQMTQEMPPIRIDNTKPDVEVLDTDAPGGSVTDCGVVDLGPTASVVFTVKAHDPKGHMLRYWISGIRGSNDSIGATTKDERLHTLWNGVTSKDVAFPVPSYPACPGGAAYSFELHVHGRSTNGYSEHLGSQEVEWTENMFIEP